MASSMKINDPQTRSNGQTESLKRTINQGISHLQKSQLNDAARCFHKVLKWLPKNKDANLRLGYICLHTGKLNDAEKYTRTALESKPKDPIIWAQLLTILNKLNDASSLSEAKTKTESIGLESYLLEQISASLALPPNSRAQGLIEIMKKNNLTNTEIAARLFIDTYPDHPLGWQVLGETLHDAGYLHEAESVKRCIAQKFKNDANVYNNLARTLITLKNYDEAFTSLRKALQIDPLHKNAQTQLAALQRLNKLNLKPNSEDGKPYAPITKISDISKKWSGLSKHFNHVS